MDKEDMACVYIYMYIYSVVLSIYIYVCVYRYRYRYIAMAINGHAGFIAPPAVTKVSVANTIYRQAFKLRHSYMCVVVPQGCFNLNFPNY